MNHTYAYSRDRKIEFRMVSAQHFINEALGEDLVPELADEAEEEKEGRPAPFSHGVHFRI